MYLESLVKAEHNYMHRPRSPERKNAGINYMPTFAFDPEE